MRALKCDNCGGYYGYSVMEITKIAWCHSDGGVVGDKDICPECLAAVAMALENRKNIKIKKKTDSFEDDRK